MMKSRGCVASARTHAAPVSNSVAPGVRPARPLSCPIPILFPVSPLSPVKVCVRAAAATAATAATAVDVVKVAADSEPEG